MYEKIIIGSFVVAILVVIFYYLRDNRRTANDLRDNNRESESINRKTSDIATKLATNNRELRETNRESTELNNDIKRDNKTAGDIIAEIRKQKLD